MIEEEIFKKTKIDWNQLEKYGFQKENNRYQYSKNIMNDTFQVIVYIDQNGKVQGKVYDISFQEEYLNFRREDGNTSFSGKVREEFINILEDIKSQCFIKEPFSYEQSNRISKQIYEKYNDEPQFEWDKFPNYAIFRNKDSNKWYAIIMDIDKSKLENNQVGTVEIMNIKLDPSEIENLLTQKGFYLAYHMNKKNWITVILDNTIPDEILMNLLNQSYSYTVRKER